MTEEIKKVTLGSIKKAQIIQGRKSTPSNDKESLSGFKLQVIKDALNGANELLISTNQIKEIFEDCNLEQVRQRVSQEMSDSGVYSAVQLQDEVLKKVNSVIYDCLSKVLTSLKLMHTWRQQIICQYFPISWQERRQLLESLNSFEEHIESCLSLCLKDELWYEAFWSLKLSTWLEQYFANGLVILPYYQDIIDEVVYGFLSGCLVVLQGDTGTGKTEIARMVLRDLRGCEPIVVSCTSDTSPEDLLGRQILTVQDGATVSSFQRSALVEALESGAGIIIDEFNIPKKPPLTCVYELVAAHSAKQPMAKYETPLTWQDPTGNLTVEVRFKPLIVCTGNVDSDFGDGRFNREDIDPALLNRCGARIVVYLPQQPINIPSYEEVKRAEKEGLITFEDKQLFVLAVLLILADQVDKEKLFSPDLAQQIIELPENALEDVWKLCRMVKMSELAALGKLNEETLLSTTNPDSVGLSGFRPRSVMSMRWLANTLKVWSSSLTFCVPLSQFVADFIDGIPEQSERAFYEALAKLCGFEIDGTKIERKSITGTTKRQRLKILSFTLRDLIRELWPRLLADGVLEVSSGERRGDDLRNEIIETSEGKISTLEVEEQFRLWLYGKV
ncbi:MAG: AAA family ATPase [Deltaproteobacteria bacterium]|nr:AAA family ATPase [Deltaproteobacteria bacterium]